ncbi:hypothetical protein [Caulobacter sp.]|uniref:hypothetical protein n=1 Tax=Caulobacter sp. TaxID=78 RepID=UPI003BAF8FFB
MSKPKPPTPANDHLAAFGKTDDLDRLTNAEIQARLETTGQALSREIRLATLRLREQTLARYEASARQDRH